VFADESGFSLIPLIRRTWAVEGQTPIIRHCFNWPKLSAISAVSTQSRIYMKLLLNKTVKSHNVIAFLSHLLKLVKGMIILVWDRIQTHRSAIVKEFIKSNSQRLKVYYLPPYAPDLNPAEGIWNHIKWQELANYCPRNLSELVKAIKRSTGNIRNRPKLIRSFLHATPLNFDHLVN